VKFDLLNFIIGLNFMNLIINNIKFIQSEIQIIACITANIFKVNVSWYYDNKLKESHRWQWSRHGESVIFDRLTSWPKHCYNIENTECLLSCD